MREQVNLLISSRNS